MAKTNIIQKIKLGLPDKIETFFLLLTIFGWAVFNDMFNLISDDPLLFNTIGVFINNVNIPVLPVLWISLLLFHIGLVILGGRSIWKKNTHHIFDLFFIIWGIIGIFLFIIALTLLLEGNPSTYIPEWNPLDVNRNGIYHIGLIIFYIPTLLWFAFTK